MSTSKQPVCRETGNLMILVLMVFVVLSVLGTALISAAGMENKVSHFAVKTQQAQQAADAGAEWAIEAIWKQGLPETFEQQIEIQPGINVSVKVNARNVAEISPGNENENDNDGNGNKNGNGVVTPLTRCKCRYQFTSKAEYEGVRKLINIEVVYIYSGNNPVEYDSADIVSYTTN